MSRRIQGQMDYVETDVRGFKSVIVFIERGFGNEVELVGHVMKIVGQVQGCEWLKYFLHFFSFGWEDQKLHHHGHSFEAGRQLNWSKCAKTLCELATTDAAVAPVLIPSFFPLADPYGRKHKAEDKDLLLFFCRNRAVRFSDQARLSFNARIARNSVWIFSENSQVEIEMSNFVPEGSDGAVLDSG